MTEQPPEKVVVDTSAADLLEKARQIKRYKHAFCCIFWLLIPLSLLIYNLFTSQEFRGSVLSLFCMLFVAIPIVFCLAWTHVWCTHANLQPADPCYSVDQKIGEWLYARMQTKKPASEQNLC